MSRADIPDRTAKMLPNFYLFVDEFQNFANASFADILSEARKYKLNLTIAHQYIEQMDEIVRPAVFGNVGTMIAFRVGATDAEELEKDFAPVFVLEDLVNLGFAQIYLKLMIDGLSSQPFSATTLPPIPHPDQSYVNEIIAASREQFARPREGVEEEIIQFHNPMAKRAPAVSVSSGTIPPNPTLPVSSNSPATVSKPASQINSGPAVSLIKPVAASNAAMVPNLPKPPIIGTIPKPGQNVPKPVSLSALSSRSSVKIDAKVPTEQNVNSLKSALQAVLKKSPAVSQHILTGSSRPVPVQMPNVLTAIPKPAVKAVGTPEDLHSVIPKEVPEDVLKSVLKDN